MRIPPYAARARSVWFGALTLFAALGAPAAFAAGSPPVHLPAPAGGSPFDGWGTSLCWFANAVGRWPEPQRSEIADALFSPAGLGLTVVRYNIGGGENPSHHHMPWFRQMDGFEPAPGTWNWNADPGQRWMLAAALQRGADRVEAFSNSPPYWMTRSQCASGAADPKTDNLAPGQEAAFAQYLVEVVKHFRTAWGIRFDTLEPMNEPFTDYWHAQGNQEGCHFERSSQARLLRRVRAELDRENLHGVAVSAADETNYERAVGTWESYDAPTRDCVAQINAHGYATEQRAELRRLARASGKPLVMSEVDGGGGSGHDHAAIGPALALAGQIIGDLDGLHPLRWVDWQAVEDEAGQVRSNQNWGLIHADLQGESHAWTLTKKYYAMANFSKFIRPGAVLLPCDAPDTVAAYDARGDEVIIVTSNGAPADKTITFDLAAYPGVAKRVTAWRTSATEKLARVSSPAVDKDHFTAVARAQSITTYVVGAGDPPPPGGGAKRKP